MKSPETYDLVEVSWLDHTFHPGPYRERGADGLSVWDSVGYLVKMTENVVVIAQSVNVDELHECLHIQAGLVLSVTRLKRRKA